MKLISKINESLFGSEGRADENADRAAERDDSRSGAASGADAEEGRPGSDAEGDGSDSAAERDEDDGADERGHGIHWNTVCHPDGQSDAVPEIVSATVEEGDVLEGAGADDADVTGYRLADGPVGTVAVTRDETVATAYPVVDGVEHDVAVESIEEWESGLEARLEGLLGEAAIATFAANYVARSPADLEDECTVSLALLAYNVGEAEYDTITTESGEEIDVSDFVGIRPWEKGTADDYVVRTEIKDVERVSSGDGAGYDGYYLRVPLLRTDEGEEFDVALFVADHVAGDYDPEVGDTVEGACWLQAWIQ